MALTELEKLQRDIDGLLQANRLEWEALASKPMSRAKRLEARQAIAMRNVELSGIMAQAPPRSRHDCGVAMGAPIVHRYRRAACRW